MQTNHQRAANLENIAHIVVAVVFFAFAMALNAAIVAGAVSQYVA